MLDPVKLEVDIYNILSAQNDNESEQQTPEQAMKFFSKQLASCIHSYVIAGIVITNGSATTQTGKIQ